jgi:hypothetical protein
MCLLNTDPKRNVLNSDEKKYPALWLCLLTKLGFILVHARGLNGKKYWSAESVMLIREVPLHNVMIGVWCAVSATRIIWLISL